MGLTREQWLAERRNHLGGSDVAAILGADKRRGPFDVYVSKVGEAADSGDNDWLKFGRNMEGAIAELYSDRTGRQIADLGATEFQRHPDIPWLAVTLDRVTARPDKDDMSPLEIKSVGMQSPKDWVINTPEYQLIQLQTQMSCTGSKHGTLAGGFFGYRIEYLDMDYSGLIEAAYPILDEFWQRVKRKDPPAVTGKMGSQTLDTVKRFYLPEEKKEIYLSNDIKELIQMRDKLFKFYSSKEVVIKQLDAEIRCALKDAQIGWFEDGTWVESALVNVKGRVQVVKDYSYTVLKYKEPKGSKSKKSEVENDGDN